MAKGSANPNWKEIVLEWEASGKSIKAWCQENKIPITTFCGWKNRFKKFNTDSVKTKAGFIELKEQSQPDPGIILEYSGIKIHLKAKFDKTALKQCLDCLRGALC
jgi:hypothetical protein